LQRVLRSAGFGIRVDNAQIPAQLNGHVSHYMRANSGGRLGFVNPREHYLPGRLWPTGVEDSLD
jgi:hypothetical protein